MPELLNPPSRKAHQSIEAGLKRIPEGPNKGARYLDPGQIEKIVEENDLAYISEGSECIVVSPQKRTWKSLWRKPEVDQRLVLAFDYKMNEKRLIDPKEAKTLFYTQRLMSTLFPHNFPHFYSAWGAYDPKQVSGTIRERKIPKKPPLIERVRSYFSKSGESSTLQKIDYPLSKVHQVLKELGWDFIYIDSTASENRIVGQDGGEYFVDKTRIFLKAGEQLDSNRWNMDKLTEYLRKNQFSQTDQHIIIGSISRIQELQKQKLIQTTSKSA